MGPGSATSARLEDLRLTLRATPGALSPARLALSEWLLRAGVAPNIVTDVVVAVCEAISNSIEHGYLTPSDHRPPPGDPAAAVGTVTVTASHRADRVTICVEDDGRWHPTEPSLDEASAIRRPRGRGLMLMRRLMSEVRVTTSDQGTVVEMSRRLR